MRNRILNKEASDPAQLNITPNHPAPDHKFTHTQRVLQVSGNCTSVSSTSQPYPLKEELNVLCEVLESIRLDFLKKSMRVNYISMII